MPRKPVTATVDQEIEVTPRKRTLKAVPTPPAAENPPAPAHIPHAPLSETAQPRNDETELDGFIETVNLAAACSPVLIQAGDLMPRRAIRNSDGSYSVVLRESMIDGREKVVMSADAETMAIMRARYEMVRTRLLYTEGYASYADRPEIRALYSMRFFQQDGKNWYTLDEQIKSAKNVSAKKAEREAAEKAAKAIQPPTLLDGTSTDEAARASVNDSLKADGINDAVSFPF